MSVIWLRYAPILLRPRHRVAQHHAVLRRPDVAAIRHVAHFVAESRIGSRSLPQGNIEIDAEGLVLGRIAGILYAMVPGVEVGRVVFIQPRVAMRMQSENAAEGKG